MKVAARPRLLLSLILIGGTALRMYHLGADSLWYDETVSVTLAGGPFLELLRHTAGDIHPPGYYALLRGWLIAVGYGSGHADPAGFRLEFAAGALSVFFGLVLIPLVYVLASHLASRRVALVAAAIVAASPYNVWYSQEVRMYTLGAALGVVVLYAMLRAYSGGSGARTWWLVYALAAAAGIYALYYFAFLLAAVNIWYAAGIVATKARARGSAASVAREARGASTAPFAFSVGPWLLANLLALLVFAPWAGIAWRQATDPPVPPWRSVTGLGPALAASWTALGLGQSATGWLAPVLAIALVLYVLGLFALAGGSTRGASLAGAQVEPGATLSRPWRGPAAALLLFGATFGSLALILLFSLRSPLFHVRYLFTYSPAFYIVLAAGVTWLWARSRPLGTVAVLLWLAGAAVTLQAFWYDPAYRADDHRAAVRSLRAQWRPGDVLLVNAGYAYPALTTYWDGPIASARRLSDALPPSRTDGALVMLETGHVDGDQRLGWGDPRSDFYALPFEVADARLQALFERFSRVWQYRIYDTVNDPQGKLRAQLDARGRLFDERIFAGEANIRLQGYAPRSAAEWDANAPGASYDANVAVRPGPLPAEVTSGGTLYGNLTWRAGAGPPAEIATSVRLVGPGGTVWAQPPDEHPLGPLFPSSQWPQGEAQRQPVALPVPPGTPPGSYAVELVVYDPATGKPWQPAPQGGLQTTPDGLVLRQVEVGRAAGSSAPMARQPLARFGPLALLSADSPATTVAAGGRVPVELLWHAGRAPAEPMVVVVQLLDRAGKVAAGLEEEPVGGSYPTSRWSDGEIVRDKHILDLPPALEPGKYTLIASMHPAGSSARLTTGDGLFGRTDHVVIKELQVE